MTKLFGKEFSRKELYRRVGNLAQVAGISEYTYNSGYADGVKAVRINTGVLDFEVLPSRCLDISHGSYKGVPFGYFSKSGIRHPSYFCKADPSGFADNFFAGVLTTCGLHNIGGPSVYNGEQHYLHGEVANKPAELVSVKEEWQGDDCLFTVSGEIHHSQFYGHDLVITRKISAVLGQSVVIIEDEVENRDFAPSACMLLYHSQFGWPFLGPATKLITSPHESLKPRAGTPEDAVKTCDSFVDPADGVEEQCFYHKFKPDSEGRATACLFNPELGEKGMGVYVRYDMSTLPEFIQWKMLRSREYVCGLEPAACSLDNRDDATMRRIELAPMEKRRFRLEYGVLEGEAACRELAGA